MTGDVHVTISIDPALIGRTEIGTARLGIQDPLLQELWAIKAGLNAAVDTVWNGWL